MFLILVKSVRGQRKQTKIYNAIYYSEYELSYQMQRNGDVPCPMKTQGSQQVLEQQEFGRPFLPTQQNVTAHVQMKVIELEQMDEIHNPR